MPGARILVVDDEPAIRLLCRVNLQADGFAVKEAPDGVEAMRIAREWQPDLILLDVMMPRISGFEVCKRLRSDPATHDVAILMITALDQHSDVERAVEAGTDDFLSKPITKAELLRRIPDWELVDPDEPKILPATFARAYDRIRIRFTRH